MSFNGEKIMVISGTKNTISKTSGETRDHESNFNVNMEVIRERIGLAAKNIMSRFLLL